MTDHLPDAPQLVKALAEREAMLRALFDNPLCAIVVTDPEGRVRSASAAALTLLDVELEALLGQPLARFVRPAGELAEIVGRDGSGRPARYHAEVLQDGLQVGVLALVRP